jgi:hypothetical protein
MSCWWTRSTASVGRHDRRKSLNHNASNPASDELKRRVHVMNKGLLYKTGGIVAGELTVTALLQPQLGWLVLDIKRCVTWSREPLAQSCG